MFICDCHCDTLTELYKKGTSFMPMTSILTFSVKSLSAAVCNSVLFSYPHANSVITAACATPCSCSTNTCKR